MSGTTKQFVDFTTATDTNANAVASVQPIANGETIEESVLNRLGQNLRVRTEAIRNAVADTLYLRDADRTLIITGPGKITWPGSTTAAATGIPVFTDTVWVMPLLTPGFAQVAPVPPVASAYGTLHLKRASDSMNSILVTSIRRSYAAGDQINIVVSAGGAFSCTLDADAGYQRTIRIVATGATTLTATINALNALVPTAPDNTQLVSAALEGGAVGADLLLTVQARQFVSGNYDGEGHAITPANVASFFVTNPTSALAEGDTFCVEYTMVTDTASTGGRRQALPENTNTAIPAASYFNSRLNPEKLVNALPICKVVNGDLVFATGALVTAGSTFATIGGSSGDVNIVRNNGFDRAVTDATGRYQIADWENRDGNGTAIWRSGTTGPRTGVRSLEFNKILVGASGLTPRVEQGQEIPVVPGQVLNVSVWVRQLIAPTAGTYSVGVYWGDLNGSTVTTTKVALQVLATTDASFRYVSQSVTVPAGKQVVKKITIESSGVTTGSTGVALLVDDLRVTVAQAAGATVPFNDTHSQLQSMQALRLNVPNAAFTDDASLLRQVASGDTVTANVTAADGGAFTIERPDQTYDAAHLPPQWAVLGRLVSVGRELMADAASARKARISVPYNTTHDVTLLFESAGTPSVVQPTLRLYMSLSGVMFETINAFWTGTNWDRDVAGNSSMTRMDDNLYEWFSFPSYGTAPWVDGDWIRSSRQVSAHVTTALLPNFDPLLRFYDAENNQRVVVDHMGLVGSRGFEVQQNWLTDPNVTVVITPLSAKDLGATVAFLGPYDCQLPSTTVPLYYPVLGLREGDLVKTWSLDISKTTDATDTVTAVLAYVDAPGGAENALSTVTNTANNPGVVTLGGPSTGVVSYAFTSLASLFLNIHRTANDAGDYVRTHLLTITALRPADGWTYNSVGKATVTTSTDARELVLAFAVDNDIAAAYTSKSLVDKGTAFAPEDETIVSMDFSIRDSSYFTAGGGGKFYLGFRIEDAAIDGCFFSQGPANFKFTVQNAAGAVSIDTGVPVPAASTTITYMRIEMYGADTPGGLRYLGYINGVLVAEHLSSATRKPENALRPWFQIEAPAAATAPSLMKIGPVTVRGNKRLVDDSL